MSTNRLRATIVDDRANRDEISKGGSSSGGEAREEPSHTNEAVSDLPQNKKYFHPVRPYWTDESKLGAADH